MTGCCEQSSCCAAPSPAAGPGVPRDLDAPYLDGTVLSAVGPVPRASGTLTPADRLGAIRIRLGVRRTHYAVPPGLYGLGTPCPDSPVLVTANYKFTFDLVRSALPGVDAWLLVLDTRGVNVWCAAGKGTFGSSELVERIRETRLADVVAHRRVVVPQLGAPGISAHDVGRQAGFRVIYGPVRIDDLPAFLDAGERATDEMRRVRFGLAERFAVTGVELAHAWDRRVLAVAALLCALAIAGLLEWRTVGLAAAAALTALLAGALVTPLALPWVPGRAFALKGAFSGAVAASLLLAAWAYPLELPAAVAVFLGMTALSSFLAMNFTGSTTFTSLSGVVWEMRRAVPVQIAAAVAAVIALIVAGVT